MSGGKRAKAGRGGALDIKSRAKPFAHGPSITKEGGNGGAGARANILSHAWVAEAESLAAEISRVNVAASGGGKAGGGGGGGGDEVPTIGIDIFDGAGREADDGGPPTPPAPLTPLTRTPPTPTSHTSLTPPTLTSQTPTPTTARARGPIAASSQKNGMARPAPFVPPAPFAPPARSAQPPPASQRHEAPWWATPQGMRPNMARRLAAPQRRPQAPRRALAGVAALAVFAVVLLGVGTRFLPGGGIFGLFGKDARSTVASTSTSTSASTSASASASSTSTSSASTPTSTPASASASATEASPAATEPYGYDGAAVAAAATQPSQPTQGANATDTAERATTATQAATEASSAGAASTASTASTASPAEPRSTQAPEPAEATQAQTQLTEGAQPVGPPASGAGGGEPTGAGDPAEPADPADVGDLAEPAGQAGAGDPAEPAGQTGLAAHGTGEGAWQGEAPDEGAPESQAGDGAQSDGGLPGTEPEPGPSPGAQPERPQQPYADGFVMPGPGVRPIAVVIDNAGDRVLPQGSLDKAQVIYELLVEGGISSFIAVFWPSASLDVPMIGPVQRVGSYFLDYAAENDALLLHISQSPNAQRDFDVVPVERVPRGIYTRITDDPGNYQDSYTTGDRLAAYMRENGVRDTTGAAPVFRYSDVPVDLADGAPATAIRIDYSSKYWAQYIYDAESGLYLRSRNGAPHMARVSLEDGATDVRLTARNVLALFVDNHTLDDEGYQSMDNVGAGTGYYFTGGRAAQITWSKASRAAPTLLAYAGTGEPVLLNPGQTYVQVTPTARYGKNGVAFD